MKRLFPNTSPAADPERARLFLQQLWSAIELVEGREITQRELSRYLGLTEASLCDWLNGPTALHQIEGVLRLLERVPPRWRRELFRAFARVYPTVHDRQLAHEPATVCRLREILKKKCGLTFITGASASERTFLITALAHLHAESGPVSRPVVGWDFHTPDWFVPVPGVHYARHDGQLIPKPTAALPPSSALALQMSNGWWRRCAAHRDRLAAAARTGPVLVADDLDAQTLKALRTSKLFPELAGSVDLLTLSVPVVGRIHVEFARA